MRKLISKVLLSAALALSFACENQVSNANLKTKNSSDKVSVNDSVDKIGVSHNDIELAKGVFLKPLFDRLNKVQGYNLSLVKEDAEVFLSLVKDNPVTLFKVEKETLQSIIDTSYFKFNDGEYDFGMLYEAPQKENASDERVLIKLGNKIFTLHRVVNSTKNSEVISKNVSSDDKSLTLSSLSQEEVLNEYIPENKELVLPLIDFKLSEVKDVETLELFTKKFDEI
jgi:ABC-type oligopeptide transport system substrate-binding subunit